MGNTESIAADEQQQSESELTQSRQHSGSHRHRRRQRRITLETSTAPPELYNDCPWWSKIENESLILDYAPNITFEVNENESVTAKATLSHDELEELIRKYETVKVTTTPRSESRADSEPKEIVPAASIAVKPKEPSKEPTPAREQSLEEFKEELRVKRLARQTAVQDLRDEISTLRQQLAQEQTRQLRSSDCYTENAAIDHKTREPSNDPQFAGAAAIKQPEDNDGAAGVDADDEDPLSRSRHANIALANVQLALQLSQAENLSLRSELDVVQKQVGTLKEVIACCKQMLAVKEEQCTQLKAKLQEIEISFGEREMKIMSNNLREEYERQLLNIRQLRQLYEERQRIAAAEQENLQRLVAIKRDELQQEQEKTKNLEECNQTLVKEVENVNNELAAIRDECNEHKFEKRALKEELGAINTLFTQMVLGFNGKNNLDIDRLTAMLEENRTLLNEMTTKEMNCSDGATLPKLLFELVEQAAVVDEDTTSDRNEDKEIRDTTPMPMSEGDAKEAVDEVDEMRVAADADTTRNVSAAGKEQTTTANADEYVADNDAGIEVANAATQLVSNKKQTARRSPHASGKSKAMLKFPEAEAMMLMGVSCNNAENDANAAAGGSGGNKVVSAQEIIGNLPKVWRVLMELLSHHKIEQVQFEENGMSEDCYKSVETPNGPKAELSVSKTYIKLKDLILEKKSLMKETNRLKTLNSHLDYRLNEQEKRLSAVSLELTKTWHLVGKMQRQHRQLHTQEQILRYQLQQKRRLLSELREELEYCRRKWAAARARNDESQEQWNDLRREFAQRKLDDANHSAESGYSDSGPASDEEAGAAVAVVGAGVVDVAAAGGVAQQSACTRRKHLKEMFEHTRKIKRMQSTSPGRAAGTQPGAPTSTAGAAEADNEEIVVLRWNSAPPTCGWRSIDNDDVDDDDTDFDDDGDAATGADELGANRGAIPKAVPHNSRSKQRKRTATVAKDIDIVLGDVAAAPPTERATRIQRLEEQCKSLIQKVLETSDNRERLEVQLCEFQEAVAPVQYAVPLEEFVGSRKRMERMTRASSAPARGSLTPREEEYTRKRSERLERLEEESRQLMSRIKRTSDRGHYLRCSLDRIRRATPRDDSCDSNTEDELPRVEEVAVAETASPLTAEEEAYTARRAARLQRLEAESQALLSTLARQTERGGSIEQKLDQLHDRYTSAETTPSTEEQPSETIEKRLENIEQISLNRDERLRLLEAEGKALLTRLTNTSERGTKIINRIAERELSREQRRASSTPKKEDAETLDVAAAELMPTANNVASSSIVDEELSKAVVVTTTSTQIGTHTGAIPKTTANKPVPPPTELSKFARAKSIKKEETKSADSNQQAETLEDMVRRLQQLPFPSEKSQAEEEGSKCEESKVEKEDANKNKTDSSEPANALDESQRHDDAE